MFKITRCPSCNSARIRKVRRNWTGEFKNKRYTVPNLEYYECPDCGEKLYTREALREIEMHSPAFDSAHIKRRSA
jgi:YgiT-type zinc finger domain-containing protein